MKFKRSILFNLFLFLFAVLMVSMEIVLVTREGTEKVGMLVFMVVLGMSSMLTGFIIGFISEKTTGIGLIILGTFLGTVGCSLPNANVGGIAELFLIYFPVILLAAALIGARGMGNFKRSMVLAVSIFYIIVFIYNFVAAFTKVPVSNTSGYSNSYFYNYLGNANKTKLEIDGALFAYGFFGLLFYILLFLTGLICFRNKDKIED